MLIVKMALYALTLGSTLFFGFWEERIKRQMSVDAPQPYENISDLTVFNDIMKRVKRERFLETLPDEQRRKLRMVVGCKLLSFLLLICEVLVLQTMLH